MTKKKDELGAPKTVDRNTFHAELDALRVREKAHTHEGDAIAATRRRLPMVEVDPTTKLIGPNGPLTLLGTFEGPQAILRLSSARDAPGSQRTSESFLISILAM